jgi:hypothetical protein
MYLFLTKNQKDPEPLEPEKFLNPCSCMCRVEPKPFKLLFLEPEPKVLRESKEPPNKDHTPSPVYYYYYL